VTSRKREDAPNLRTGVRRAAAEANVAVNEYERAIVLGQVAELLALHPQIGGRIAFKGGAVMTLFDQSPRLSRDLDAVLVSGGGITEKMVREALGTPAATKVVVRIDRFVTVDGDAIRFPLIVCRPFSGQGQINVQISINWSSPLLCDPEFGEFEVGGRRVTLRLMARRERLAEKVRAFLDRGEDRDAFDLSHYVERGLRADEWKDLPRLVSEKLRVDPDILEGTDLHVLFDRQLEEIGLVWGTRGGLTLMRARPSWDVVRPRIVSLQRYVPARKP
jgi:hypothetical protein